MARSGTLLAVLMIATCAHAQEAPRVSYSFDHVALSVSDVEASAVFYESLLGMERITDRTPIDGVRWLSMQGGGELHLLAIVDGAVQTNQAVHMAIRTPDFDELMARIRAMGVEYTTWLGNGPGITARDDGTRQVYLRDPDGYWIELIGLPGGS